MWLARDITGRYHLFKGRPGLVNGTWQGVYNPPGNWFLEEGQCRKLEVTIGPAHRGHNPQPGVTTYPPVEGTRLDLSGALR